MPDDTAPGHRGASWRARTRSALDAGRRGAGSGWAWVDERRAQVAVVVGGLLALAGVAGFLGVLDSVQERDDLAAVDEPVLSWLVGVRSDAVSGFMAAVSAVTGPVVLPVLVVVASVVWGLVAKGWWQAGLLAGAMVLSTVVSVTLKGWVARPRPPVDAMYVPGSEPTYSFPSGHTIGTATFLLVVAYLLWVRRPTVRGLVLALPLVVLGVAVVALSRLYLGYHFVTDVVASTALAVSVLGVVVVVDRRRAARAAAAVARG